MGAVLLRKELRDSAQYLAHPLAPILGLPPLRMAHASAQALPLAVVEWRDRHPAVAGAEGIEAAILWHLVLELLVRLKSIAQIGRVVRGKGHHRFGHRHADILANPARP